MRVRGEDRDVHAVTHLVQGSRTEMPPKPTPGITTTASAMNHTARHSECVVGGSNLQQYEYE
eukprot:9565279-Alexandrium_andersonii.AAC.1